MGSTPRGQLVDRVSTNDAMILAVDRGSVPMNIAALLLLSPEALPPADAVRRTLAARVGAVPRLRQVLTRTPPGLGRPVWCDDRGFDVERHLDTRVVDEPADTPGALVGRGLLDQVTELVVDRLPRDRPLWRARILADAEGRALAVAIVLHHVVADGMGGLAALAALVDEGAADGAQAAPRPPPGPADLASDAWSHRFAALRGAPARLGRLGGAGRELGISRPQFAQACSLLVPTSGRRRVDLAAVPLADLRAAGRRRGVSINDLVVTAVTGALVALLARRGESVDALVVSVPVSSRSQDQAGEMGNSTGVLPLRVPAVPEAEARLAAVTGQSARLGASARGSSAALLTPAFRVLAGVGLMQPFVTHQRLVHTFETNLRGPEVPLHLAGAEVGAIVPVVVNPGNVTIAFDVLSYAGRLVVAVVSDPDHVVEGAWLAERVQEELALLGGSSSAATSQAPADHG